MTLFRRDHACKTSRDVTMEHVVLRVWDRSDPVFLDITLREKMKRRRSEPLPTVVEDMIDKEHPYYNIDNLF